MMARSGRSNQRPDTVTQDHIIQVETVVTAVVGTDNDSYLE